MKSIVVHETGGPDVMRLQETSVPEPGDGELLVAVKAAGVNYIDTYHRTGLYPMDLPMTPGLEGAGEVIETGTGVEDFSPGDRVAWVGAIGSYADRHVVAAEKAIPVPAAVDLKTAAAALLQGMTAHYLAVDTFPIRPGDRCLIHAGAGGVGLLLTQIAKLRGAEVVTTVGTEEKASLSRENGADHVIVYSQVDFKGAVEELFGPKALDVVYDGVGAVTFDASLKLIRARGMMVTFGNASGPVPEISPLRLSAEGSIFLTRPTLFDYTKTRDELLSRASDLFEWIADGELEVRVGARFDLAEAPAAHTALESRATTGKLLLIPAE